jgi:hypothetical protein
MGEPDGVNMFDHCQLATTIKTYFKKIHNILEDNFNVTSYFGCAFDEKQNSTMVLNINTGELLFRERTVHDRNIINSKQAVVVHYFLQIAVWMIYNTLNDQRRALSCVLDNFYDYMFGPIMTSVVFFMDPKNNYVSELPSVYLDCVPIVTEVCNTTD